MINLTYAGQVSDAENRVMTLSDVPTLLTVEDTNYENSTPIEMTYYLSNGLDQLVTGDSQYSITIMGDTITNVMDYANATNKRFKIFADKASTLYSIVQALRNCPTVSAQFYITNSESFFTLTSRDSAFTLPNNFFSTTIPSKYIDYEQSGGINDSELDGGKVGVDVNMGGNGWVYQTTLEKNVYNGKCSFDMSPIVSTLTNYGEYTDLLFDVYSIDKNGNLSSIGDVYTRGMKGYECNTSERNIPASTYIVLLPLDPATRYMVVDQTMYITAMNPTTDDVDVEFTVYDSNMKKENSWLETCEGGQTNELFEIQFSIPDVFQLRAYWVGVKIGANVEQMFKIIRGKYDHYTCVKWRNQYGGWSFMPFTGGITHSINEDTTVYSLSPYVQNPDITYGKERMYDNNVEETITLTTAIVDKGIVELMNEMAHSKYVEMNSGNAYTYIMIPTDYSINQLDDNAYTATVTLRYGSLK